MENKECKCGCGTLITSKYQKYHDTNYIKGHGRKHKHNSIEHNQAISEKNKNGIYKKCEYCNEEFYVQMSKLNRGTKFCSKDCYTNSMIGIAPIKAINKLIGSTHFVSQITRDKIGKANLGEKNGMWNNGGCEFPYDKEFSKRFKNIIRKRDNQVCMNCGVHREKLSQSLHVHHIDYNKHNTIKENCISLCNSCHGFTRLNQEYWIGVFRNKLSKNYGYQYNKEITFEIVKEI